MVQPTTKRLVTEAKVDGHVLTSITSPGATKDAIDASINTQVNAAVPGAVETVAVPKTKDAGDTFADVTRRLQFTDGVGAKGSQVNFEHFADGTGRPTGAGAGQTYALDIHNNVGAKSAIVVHQYSNLGPAVRLDNTGTGTMLLIAQTNNPAKNPASADGTNATGNAITVVDNTGVNWFRVDGRGSLIMTPPADASQHTIDIATNAGATKRAIKVTANSAAHAVEIQANAGSTGQYPLYINGYSHGAQLSTSQNGGFVLGLTRTATGSGDVANLRNDGTGKTILLRQGTTTVAQFNADGELENLTAGKGHLMKSPDGTRYRVSVANGGTISVVAA